MIHTIGVYTPNLVCPNQYPLKKILIIGDDADILDLVEVILRDNGYAVIKANRKVSINEIISLKPDLTIIDVILPFGLGTDLCFELKNNDLTKHLAVIIFSASSNIEKLALNSCADGYIAKPFEVDDFIRLVGRMVC
jgi:two-component system phosphate regulon response regulator PhoB